MSNTLPGNIIQHFKGGIYKVLFKARDARTGAPVIVYIALSDGTIWVRNEVEFNDEVSRWPDGVMRKRFIVVDPHEP